MRKAIRAVQKAHSTPEAAKMTADEVVQHEMQAHLIELARRLSEPGDKKKKIWAELARVTGLTFNQCERIWQLEWKVIPGSVVRLLDSKVAELERKNDAAQETLRIRQEALNGRSADPSLYATSTSKTDQQINDVG